jgi:hypothetical protein
MLSTRSLIPFLFSLTSIYQSTDDTGALNFSDQPSQTATTLTLPISQMYHSQFNAESHKKNEVSPSFSTTLSPIISIISPHNQETIRNNQGKLTVIINLSTSPLKKKFFQLFLDGSAVGKKQSKQRWKLNNISRGEHYLACVLESEKGKVITKSKKTIFYMHRTSKHIKN